VNDFLIFGFEVSVESIAPHFAGVLVLLFVLF
jgi:hypothetical protein